MFLCLNGLSLDCHISFCKSWLVFLYHLISTHAMIHFTKILISNSGNIRNAAGVISRDFDYFSNLWQNTAPYSDLSLIEEDWFYQSQPIVQIMWLTLILSIRGNVSFIFLKITISVLQECNSRMMSYIRSWTDNSFV